MDDVRAVLDATGSERAALLGVSEGGPLSMLFAATYPERTRRCCSSAPRSRRRRPTTGPGARRPGGVRGVDGALPERWGEGLAARSSFPTIPNPGRTQSGSASCRRPRRHRGTRSPSCAWPSRSTCATSCPAVRVPTLILHSVGDPICHVENARYLARSIPGAQYVELPGNATSRGPRAAATTSWPRSASFSPASARRPSPTACSRRCSSPTSSARPSARPSSATGAGASCSSPPRDVRRELERFRGREIDTAGDGFLATFDGPARAIRCARGGRRCRRGLGLDIRAGVHTGRVRGASATSWPASPCTSARASPPRPARRGAGLEHGARIWSPARGSSSRTAGRTC